MSYADFLASKRQLAPSVGIDVDRDDISPVLFDFQRDLVRWALRKGRSAIFADTGLGKTLMQLEWARLTSVPVLIAAPLAVARQTVREAEKLGIDAVYARSQADAGKITVTNYEMLKDFDPSAFGAVVLDESSILKAHDGKTRTRLIETFAGTPYRLCCTATPAPNDIAEIANHSEFLGIASRTEMLATFFVHDDNGWRLKRHATEPFYRWLASWGMTLKRPSDLGYPDDGFDLPPLDIRLETVASDYVPAGQMFATGLSGIVERSTVRKETVARRVAAAVALIQSHPDEPWIAWCGLNTEASMLAAALGSADAVNVEGAMSPDSKEQAIEGFLSGYFRVLVSKPRIAGFGLNFQHVARMCFVGLSDSYEQYYQCIRRSWRFGQQRPVTAHVVLTDVERPIFDNVLRKEREAANMTNELVGNVAEFERAEIADAAPPFTYTEDEAEGKGWRLLLGDSIERIKELPTDSIDLSVFSPPFQALYTYSATERDLGNSKDAAEFWEHFGFLIDDLLRVTKPGRNLACHVANLATTQSTHGVIGLSDFRGDTIRAFQSRGFVYHGEVCIDKNPQSQAIRTHAKGLLFVQKGKDSTWLRPALADYILVFRKPGENAVPVIPDVSNDEWITWAHPVWYGIRETDTLNVAEARGPEDERHICPLQLGTIERCVRLWSNPGETVLSPFAGIGSEGYESIRLGRRFIGIELNGNYWKVACKNLVKAESMADELTLLDEETG